MELPEPVYESFAPERIPCSFQLSTLAVAGSVPTPTGGGWITLSYPSLSASVYCTYLPLAPDSLEAAFEDARRLLIRQAGETHSSVDGYVYNDPQAGVYAMLYELSAAPVSPLQFTLTDSVAHFFRGTLLYDQATLDADSLAPVTDYLKADIRRLIETFRWTHP
jgi:gliding motility-associated lipoprotein GldD